jgi:hypothetical protein
MLAINKKYVLDEQMKKVAVQLDVHTYEKMEQLLEDYALTQFMKQNKKQDLMILSEAKKAYQKMQK